MNDGPFISWEWVTENLDLITERLAEHLLLTAIALVVGTAISFGLAVLIYRRRRLSQPIIQLTGVMYTIPSLALFAFLVPFTGLSLLSAEIGLVGYTLLILIRSIIAGLDGVPPMYARPQTGWATVPGAGSGRSSCRSPSRLSWPACAWRRSRPSVW